MSKAKVTGEDALTIQKNYRFSEALSEEFLKISGQETAKQGIRMSENRVVVELCKKALGWPNSLTTIK